MEDREAVGSELLQGVRRGLTGEHHPSERPKGLTWLDLARTSITAACISWALFFECLLEVLAIGVGAGAGLRPELRGALTAPPSVLALKFVL